MSAIPAARAITCTRCGGALTLRSERAETAVCPYCHAQLDLTSESYAFLEQLQQRPDDMALSLGLHGKLEGVDYLVAGFVRWDDPEAEGACLDDYFMQGQSGRTGWLRFDGWSWRICHVLRPADAEPVDLQALDPASQWVDFDGEHHLVLERSRGTVTYLEGELFWKVRVGEAVTRLRCDPDVSVEVGPTRVRYFRWQPLAWENLAESFRVPDEAVRPVRYDVPQAPKRKDRTLSQEDDRNMWIWVAVPVIAMVAIVWGLLVLNTFLRGDSAPGSNEVPFQRPPSPSALKHR